MAYDSKNKKIKAIEEDTEGTETDTGTVSEYHVSVLSIPVDQEDKQTATESYTTRKIEVITEIHKITRLANDDISEAPTPTQSESNYRNEEIETDVETVENYQQTEMESIPESKVGLLIEIDEEPASTIVKKVEPPPVARAFENEKVILVLPPEVKPKVVAPPPPPPLPPASQPKINLKDIPQPPMCVPVKPDIIIGEIDKDEATLIYENLLGIGRRVIDWLHINYGENNSLCSAPNNANCREPDERSRKEAQAFQRQIISIETEYNRIKQDVKSARPPSQQPPDCPDALNNPDEQIKSKDIQPKVFSTGSEKNRKIPINFDNRAIQPMQRPTDPMPSCHCNGTRKVESPVSFCLEDRLAKLEIDFVNHEGNFSNVVKELRACLDYCNTFSDDNNDEIRARIAALYKIVELHKAALEDWKNELNKRKPR